jgi:hypothetical protein
MARDCYGVLDIRTTITASFCLFRFVARALFYRECGKPVAPQLLQLLRCFFGAQIVTADAVRLIPHVEEHHQF